MLYRDSDDILFDIEFQDVEMNTDEYIALGQVYHHSETLEFIQQMEEIPSTLVIMEDITNIIEINCI